MSLKNKSKPPESPGGLAQKRGLGKSLSSDSHYTTQSRPVRLVTGQQIGEVLGDTLRRKVHSKKHLLRFNNSWSFELTCLRELHSQGVKWVEVYAKDTKTIYKVSMDTFWSDGEHLDFGYGKQVALPLKFWHKHSLQLPLWGGE